MAAAVVVVAMIRAIGADARADSREFRETAATSRVTRTDSFRFRVENLARITGGRVSFRLTRPRRSLSKKGENREKKNYKRDVAVSRESKALAQRREKRRAVNYPRAWTTGCQTDGN